MGPLPRRAHLHSPLLLPPLSRTTTLLCCSLAAGCCLIKLPTKSLLQASMLLLWLALQLGPQPFTLSILLRSLTFPPLLALGSLALPPLLALGPITLPPLLALGSLPLPLLLALCPITLPPLLALCSLNLPLLLALCSLTLPPLLALRSLTPRSLTPFPTLLHPDLHPLVPPPLPRLLLPRHHVLHLPAYAIQLAYNGLTRAMAPLSLIRRQRRRHSTPILSQEGCRVHLGDLHALVFNTQLLASRGASSGMALHHTAAGHCRDRVFSMASMVRKK